MARCRWSQFTLYLGVSMPVALGTFDHRNIGTLPLRTLASTFKQVVAPWNWLQCFSTFSECYLVTSPREAVVVHSSVCESLHPPQYCVGCERVWEDCGGGWLYHRNTEHYRGCGGWRRGAQARYTGDRWRKSVSHSRWLTSPSAHRRALTRYLVCLPAELLWDTEYQNWQIIIIKTALLL